MTVTELFQLLCEQCPPEVASGRVYGLWLRGAGFRAYGLTLGEQGGAGQGPDSSRAHTLVLANGV
jgi:hypothetical protein